MKSNIDRLRLTQIPSRNVTYVYVCSASSSGRCSTPPARAPIGQGALLRPMAWLRHAALIGGRPAGVQPCDQCCASPLEVGGDVVVRSARGSQSR